MRLPLVGLPLTEVDPGIQLNLRFGSNTAFLQIEGEVRLVDASGNRVNDPPGNYSKVSIELHKVLGEVVAAATADEQDGLRIIWESGMDLSVPIDRRYESWHLHGDNGYLVVCMPGGEFAIWSGQ